MIPSALAKVLSQSTPIHEQHTIVSADGQCYADEWYPVSVTDFINKLRRSDSVHVLQTARADSLVVALSSSGRGTLGVFEIGACQ